MGRLVSLETKLVGIVGVEVSKVQPELKSAESLYRNRKNTAPRAGRLVPLPVSRKLHSHVTKFSQWFRDKQSLHLQYSVLWRS